MVYIAVPKDYSDIECCSKSLPLDAAISELNGRENLLWANAKISGQQFLTDAEIDAEKVQGKIHGRLNNDLGPNYTWSVSPTATGGTISYKYSEGVVLYRTPATLKG